MQIEQFLINDNNLKGMMPDDQAKIWQDNTTHFDFGEQNNVLKGNFSIIF